jgi:hypothetical protein
MCRALYVPVLLRRKYNTGKNGQKSHIFTGITVRDIMQFRMPEEVE